MKKIIIFTLQAFIIWLLSSKIVFADLQKDLINKLSATRTLSFNFKQKIGEKEETGICYIKYPLLIENFLFVLYAFSIIGIKNTEYIINIAIFDIIALPIRNIIGKIKTLENKKAGINDSPAYAIPIHKSIIIY